MAGREVDAALVECGGDRNEDERGEGKTSKRKKGRKGKEMGEERRERKEGVRVRGLEESNKELLRYDRQTATTWPHYGRFSPAERLFSSLPRRLSFPPLFSFPYPPISWTSVPASCPCLAHETFQTRQYVMFEGPRVTPSSASCLRSFYVE